MRIDLGVTDEKTDKALGRLEKALERLEQVQRSFADSIRQTANAADQAAGAFGRMASGAQRAKQATAQRMAAPPVTNWAAFRDAAAARMAADPNDQSAVRDYNRAVKKLNAQTPQAKVMRAMMRSRWTNIAGKLVGHPLGVDVMGLAQDFGPGVASRLFGGALAGDAAAGGGAAGAMSGAAALAGPLTIAAAAVVAFATAVKMAHGSLMDAAKQGALSGDYGAKYGYGSVIKGVTGREVGDLSRQVQSGLESDYGRAYAAKLGINPIGGPMGDINYSAKFQKVALDIANSRSIEEARRKAETVGAPELANLYLANPSNKRYLAEKFSPDMNAMGTAVDMSVSMEKIGNSIGKMSTLLAPVMQDVADSLDATAKLFDLMRPVLDFFMMVDPLAGLSRQLHDLSQPKARREEATEKNTKAVNENTRAMKEFRETLGGGERADSALPSKFRGFQMDRQNLQEIRLGGLGA